AAYRVAVGPGALEAAAAGTVIGPAAVTAAITVTAAASAVARAMVTLAGESDQKFQVQDPKSLGYRMVVPAGTTWKELTSSMSGEGVGGPARADRNGRAMNSRPAAGGGRWVDVDPRRVPRWIENFTARHGAPEASVAPYGIRLTAPDGATA